MRLAIPLIKLPFPSLLGKGPGDGVEQWRLRIIARQAQPQQTHQRDKTNHADPATPPDDTAR